MLEIYDFHHQHHPYHYHHHHRRRHYHHHHNHHYYGHCHLILITPTIIISIIDTTSTTVNTITTILTIITIIINVNIFIIAQCSRLSICKERPGLLFSLPRVWRFWGPSFVCYCHQWYQFVLSSDVYFHCLFYPWTLEEERKRERERERAREREKKLVKYNRLIQIRYKGSPIVRILFYN